MKLIEEQVKKLAEGKATLRADHNKPEQMEEVMRATKWDLSSSDWDDYKFIYLFETGGSLLTWNATDSEQIIKNEILNLSDFYESESGVEEIEFKSYKPKTAEERDQMVKDLQAIEFKKVLPSELEKGTLLLSREELTLFKLLRMRDVYRDGWVSETGNNKDKYWVWYRHGSLFVEFDQFCSSQFSFKNEDTAELFLTNFKEELEQVKELIS